MKSKHKKVKILIAEDDRVSSKILEKYITGWGYDVLVGLKKMRSGLLFWIG